VPASSGFRCRFQYAIACGVLAAFAVPVAVANAAPLTVASYNIHHAAGTDDVVDLERIATVIAGFGANIVGLQENDIANARTGFVHQPDVLAQRMSALTGSNWVALTAPAIDYQGGQYGNAVLFDADTLSLRSFTNLALPDPQGDGARSAGIANFEMQGVAFQFATTHLTHRNSASDIVPGSTIQIDSLNLIDAGLDASLPAIVNGDFNAAVQAEADSNPDTMAHWASLGWRIDSLIDSPTLDGGSFAIDFNTSRGLAGWSIIGNEVFSTGLAAIASDHYPVVTRYEVPTAAVPTPTSAALLLAGITGVLLRRRSS
jgi:endonuclease/exonuclease/phosphatase family metal-dependent hydrolase